MICLPPVRASRLADALSSRIDVEGGRECLVLTCCLTLEMLTSMLFSASMRINMFLEDLCPLVIRGAIQV